MQEASLLQSSHRLLESGLFLVHQDSFFDIGEKLACFFFEEFSNINPNFIISMD